jgi:flavin-binding protein dodecin
VSVLKHIEITGESPESWAIAAREAVDEARKTIRHLRHAEVTRLTIRLSENDLFMYQTTMKLAFAVMRDEDSDEEAAIAIAEEILEEVEERG